MEAAEELSVLTWNIWTTGPGTQHRIRDVAKQIEDLKPDVVGLQEVSWKSVDILSEAPWWGLYTSDINARRHQRSSDPSDFMLLLLKVSRFTSISKHAFRRFPNTLMGRGLLAVQADFSGTRFCFVTTHLDSPGGNGADMDAIRRYLNRTRKVQAKQTWKLLEHSSRELIMFGDMNWIDEEQGRCPLPPGWCDPWELLAPKDDPGFTYDCQTNRMMGPRVAANRYRSRLDRFWCRLEGWQPEHIQITGNRRIEGAARLDVKGYDGRHLPLLPSDHYALYARFAKRI